MNKVVLMGRLARDPVVKYTQGQDSMAIARYTLAVDRRRGKDQKEGQQTADFIGCLAFGKMGEFAEKYLHKGIKICVSGRIQTGSYTNKNGQKVYTTDVVVDDQEFAESKGSSSGNSTGSVPSAAAPASSTPVQNSSGYSDGPIPGFTDVPDEIDEELPFS